MSRHLGDEPEIKGNQSGWGAFSAFKKEKDTHGDSVGSFSVFTIFFVLLALCGVGYYTYQGAFGAVRINAVPVDIDLSNGLVAHWTFDANSISGTTVTDMTYGGSNGTLVNSPSTAIGRLGQAVSLNGTNQYVSVGNVDLIDGATAASVCLWLKYAPSSVTTDGSLVAKWTSVGWILWVDDVGAVNGRTNTISFAVDAGAAGPGRVEGSNNLVSPGEWSHYCGTFQGGSYIRLYKNGSLSQENTTSVVSAVHDNANELRIGDSASSGSIKYLDGSIDDVRIYNRALSTQEVEALYELGERTKINTTQTPFNLDVGLVGHWTFDGPDMTTATATDVSGNGNDGTLTNGPQKTIGKTGQALSFDGVDDYVSGGTQADITGAISIAFWALTGDTKSQAIISNRNGGSGYGVRMQGEANSYKLRFTYFGVNDYESSTGAYAADTSWHHYVITNDLTNTRFYVDGVLVSTALGAAGNTSTGVLQIGDMSSVSGSEFNGQLDDVRLYNRVLSSDEVAQLYVLGGGSKIKICRESSVQDADANTYNTIAIGSQCWLDRNMNVGTRINASTAQTNNGTIEKYCYSNSDSNCTSNNPNKPDGGLYQWNEAMQYSTEEGSRGICPVGFRIPTIDDFTTLGRYLSNQISDCTVSEASSYVCNLTALNKLLPGGTSGFEGNTTGYITGGSSVLRTFFGRHWISQESGSDAVFSFLAPGSGIFSSSAPKTDGASVRCIQD